MDKIDKDKAQTNPASVFDKPADVVTNKELTSAEKTKVLQEWELDARLLDVATEEGMTKDDDLAVKKSKKSPLREIKKAQQDLGVKPLNDDAPTKF